MTEVDYRLYIDVSSLIHSNVSLTGIQRVEYHTMRYFVDQPKVGFVYFSVTLGEFVVIDNEFITGLVGKLEQGGQIQKAIAKARRTLEKVAKRRLAGRANDVLLVSYGFFQNRQYVVKIQALGKRLKLAQIIQDIIPVKTPQFCFPEATENFLGYKKILAQASCIITTSGNNERDIRQQLKTWKLPAKPIVRTSLTSDLDQPPATSRPAGVSQSHYALYVSTIEIRKNHNLLAQTYRLAAEQGIKLPHLYLVGRVGWLADDFLAAIKSDPILKKKITHLGIVSNLELAWLYNQAAYTLYPSYYEGWGLPISESLAYGCVTLSSNAASLPEAGGRFADYFSPHSSRQLLQLMIKYQDKRTRARRQVDIRANYRHLTWDQVLSDLKAKLDRLASG